jgi:perosamine synthetase
MLIRYPVYQPSLAGNEEKYVMDCLRSTWISSKGEYIQRFEKGFGQYIGVNHAATVVNGTLALHLALVALGIGEDDEVIVPTLTYIASANAISYTGAKPVFVDSLTDTWQMDCEDILKKITPKTKAIMAVHLYGHPCDMDRLTAICKKYNLFLIEDCAEAIGSLYKGKHVGTFGDIATFSFYGNKTITTGEGGMVVTNDETLHDRVLHFKGQGLAKHREYWHDVIGYNYRMTNICAAIGLAQLENVEGILKKKNQIAEWYKEGLKDSSYSFHKAIGDVKHSYWMCSILIPTPENREPLRNYLAEKGIETRPLFYPIHTMPMYAKKFERHKVAEFLGWRGVNLPSYPNLSFEDIKFISETLKEFIKDEGDTMRI